jgi:hypothetical protein
LTKEFINFYADKNEISDKESGYHDISVLQSSQCGKRIGVKEEKRGAKETAETGKTTWFVQATG